MRERGKRPRRIEKERERTKADGGIIIKRDISYVGGRIVSATRHTRRFCARKARSCAAPLIKGTRVRALARLLARAFNKKKAPRCECAPELSRPYVNRSGPSAHEGPLPKKRVRGGGEEGGGGGGRGREGAARAASIKSGAATATAAINTHLFRSVLHARETLQPGVGV